MIKSFLLTLFIFLGIDFVWLGVVAKSFYEKELSYFNRTLNIPAAFLAYIVLSFGIAYFVLPKAGGSWINAAINGAFFGLVAYGVYDLSNLATLADFTVKMALVDVLWGMTICALVSLLVTAIT